MHVDCRYMLAELDPGEIDIAAHYLIEINYIEIAPIKIGMQHEIECNQNFVLNCRKSP
jgi:hypothetical protein